MSTLRRYVEYLVNLDSLTVRECAVAMELLWSARVDGSIPDADGAVLLHLLRGKLHRLTAD